MLTMQSKKQRTRSPLAAIALLGVLLGAQGAVFATVDPPLNPAAYKYGVGVGGNAFALYGSNTAGAASYIVSHCTSHYKKETDQDSCISGAEFGYGGTIA